MTTRRIYLKDYTEAELREMPAGPLCDWLVAQTAGREPLYDSVVRSFRVRCVGFAASWYDDRETPQTNTSWSADWSAAGPLLERLMLEELGHVWPRVPGGFEFLTPYRVDQWRVVARADTPQLAIARAALVLARRKLDPKESEA